MRAMNITSFEQIPQGINTLSAQLINLSHRIECLEKKIPDRLLSRKEAAKTLGISTATLDRRTDDGIILCIRLGNRVLYKESVIKALSCQP